MDEKLPRYERILGDLRSSYDVGAADRDRAEQAPWKLGVRQRFLDTLRDEGAATLLGVCLVAIPAAVPWALLSFALVLTLTGYAGLSTLVAALIIVFYVACIAATGLLSPLGAFALAMFALVVWTHRSNILRMLQGSESRFERVMIWRRMLGTRH